VQRVSAVLLLVLFSFSLIGMPALNNSETKLPECCRRDGKHHCALSPAAVAMMQDSMEDRESQDASGPGMKSMAEKCQYPSGGAAAVAHGKTPLLPAVVTTPASLVSHPASQAQTEARYRVSFSRVRQKRGPPSLLS
jgi:hypothetical protein